MDIFRSGIDRVGIYIDVLGIWYSDIFVGSSSGFGSIIGLEIFYFGHQVVFNLRFSGGIRVEVYASGGASFARCYK